MKNQVIKAVVKTGVLVAILAAATQAVSAHVPLANAPDAGTSSALLGIACVGLCAVRRFKR